MLEKASGLERDIRLHLVDRSLGPDERVAQLDDAEQSALSAIVKLQEWIKLANSLKTVDADIERRTERLEVLRKEKEGLSRAVEHLKDRVANLSRTHDMAMSDVTKREEALFRKAEEFHAAKSRGVQCPEDAYNLDWQIFRLWKPWLEDAIVRIKIMKACQQFGEDYSI